MRAIRRQFLVSLAAIMLAAQASAMTAQRADGPEARVAVAAPPARTVQGNGMSLSEAVESVRRRGDVERVISAETRVSNGREVHYIRVMTKDGKVKTHRVNGQRRN